MIDVELLRQEALIDMINEFQPGELRLSQSGILPRQEGAGRQFAWDILGIERDIPKLEGLHAPARPRKLQVIKQQSARLARSFKSVHVPASLLIDLRNPGSDQRQRVAEDTVGRELRALSMAIDRTNEFMIAGALQGSLTLDLDELSHTIDYGFSASHILSIGSGIPLAWDDQAANVVKDIRSFRTLIEEDSGFSAGTVWTSSEVIDALIRNDFVNSYFASTPAGVQALTEGQIGRFYGLNWVAYDGTYKDSNGDVQRYIPKNKLIVTPAPNDDWGFMRVGSDAVPTDDGMSAMERIGRYSYADVLKNPAAIALFAGEVRLPVIRIPDAVVVATVLN